MLVFISLGPTSTRGMAGTHGISASPESMLGNTEFLKIGQFTAVFTLL